MNLAVVGVDDDAVARTTTFPDRRARQWPVATTARTERCAFIWASEADLPVWK